MTACAGCGDCCRVIGLASPPEAFAAPVSSVRFVTVPEPGTDATAEEQTAYQIDVAAAFGRRHEYAFIQAHFHAVSREEAVRINPSMAHPQRARDFFYTCDAFAADTNRCTLHDERPSLCRDFPWYGVLAPNPLALATFPRCSYHHDYPRSLWPAGAEPLPDPDARPLPALNCC